MEFYKAQFHSLEQKLSQFEEETFIYKRAELAINACQVCLSALRSKLSTKPFRNEQEECFFFKEIKPKVVGYLYFYINLIELERYKPVVEGKASLRYYLEFISGLRKFFVQNREFYEYYLRGHSHRDMEFFCRRLTFHDLHLNSIVSILDTNFNTSHDLILARIIGNNITIDYISNQYFRKPKQKSKDKINSSLKWTGAKIDLVELVYALHSSGLVNNGQAGLNELAQNLETIFSIKIPDIYRSFLEIRARKTTPTKLLDILKTSLINKMVEADG